MKYRTPLLIVFAALFLIASAVSYWGQDDSETEQATASTTPSQESHLVTKDSTMLLLGDEKPWVILQGDPTQSLSEVYQVPAEVLPAKMVFARGNFTKVSVLINGVRFAYTGELIDVGKRVSGKVKTIQVDNPDPTTEVLICLPYKEIREIEENLRTDELCAQKRNEFYAEDARAAPA